MRRYAPFLMILSACGQEVEPTQVETATLDPGIDDAPAAYEYDPGDEVTNFLEVEDIGLAVQDALVATVQLHADPVFAAYHAVMAEADEQCPSYYSYDGNSFWYDYCTSDSGAVFDGYGFYYLYEDYDDGDRVWNGEALNGLARVTDSQGRVFDAAGEAGTMLSAQDGWTIFYSYVYGGFTWDGDEADDTWMDTGARPDLVAYAAYADEGGGWYYYVDGDAGGVADGVAAVAFNELLLGNAAGGVKCTKEPIGDVSVRDEEGNWYLVDFDATQGSAGQACDGCGTVTVEGQSLGEACVDLSDLEAALPW